MSEMLAYTIRDVRADEVPLLGPIEKRAGELFKTVGMADISEGDPLPEEFARAFTREGVAVAVADGSDRVVGFALASTVDGALHLYEVSVDPDHARRGLGARLLAAVAERATAHGARAITLATFRDVPWNAPFYAKHGFRVLDRHEWTPGLHVLRLREEDGGLPVERRCFMRKDI